MSLGDIVKEAKSNGFSRDEIINMLVKKGYSKKEIENELGGQKNTSVKKDVAAPTESYNMVKKFGMLFSKPTTFFDLVRDNHIGYSIGFLAAIMGIYLVMSYVLRIVLYSAMGGGYYGGMLGVFSLAFMIIPFIMLLVSTFVFAGIMHGVAKLMKGEGRFVDTYNVFAYSMGPTIALSIIPFVGWLSFIYSIILMVFGISSVHNLSKGKSTVAVLTPVIGFIGLIIFLVILLWIAVAGIAF